MAALPLDLPLEYVRLGLRFDRLESGFVDAYTGDPRLRAEVADEPAPTPSGLRDQARALLRKLDAADLAADRSEYLRGQLTGLCRWSGRRYRVTFDQDVSSCAYTATPAKDVPAVGALSDAPDNPNDVLVVISDGVNTVDMDFSVEAFC